MVNHNAPRHSKRYIKSQQSAGHPVLTTSLAMIVTTASLVGGATPAMAEEAESANLGNISNNSEIVRIVESTKSKVELAKEALDQAQYNSDQVKAAQQAAIKALDEATSKLDEAALALNKANVNVVEAQDRIDQANKAIEVSQNAVSNLESQVKEAQAALDAYQPSVEISKANAALETAMQLLDSATKKEEEAKANLANANKTKDEAQTTVDNTKVDLEKVQKELDDLKANAPVDDDRQQQLDAAKTVLDNANQKVSESKQAYDSAAAKFESAKANEQSSASKLKAIQNEQAKAQSIADQAKSDADLSEEQISKGTYGFFQSRGSTKAMKVLTDKAANRNVESIDLGAKNDATSLDNMKLALSWISNVNDYRAKHGLSALMVSDDLMAMAEANSDWSKNNIDHSHVFAVTENLSWGYSDPVGIWYSEKSLWDEAVKKDPSLAKLTPYQVMLKNPNLYGQTGHYLNMLDPGIKTMGAGTNTNPSSRYGRTDSWTASASTTGGVTQSVSTYIAEFNKYYDALKQAPQNYQKALDDLDAAKSATNKALQTYNNNAKALEAAKQDATQAEKAYLDAVDEAKTAQSSYDDLKNASPADPGSSDLEYNSRLEAAQAKVDSAVIGLEKAEGNLEDAKNRIEEAQAAYDDAVGVVESAKSRVESASKRLDEVQSGAEEAELKTAVETVKIQLDKAQDKLKIASDAKIQAENELIAAKSAQAAALEYHTQAEEAYEILSKVKSQVDSLVVETDADLEAARKAYDQAVLEADKSDNTVIDGPSNEYEADGDNSDNDVPSSDGVRNPSNSGDGNANSFDSGDNSGSVVDSEEGDVSQDRARSGRVTGKDDVGTSNKAVNGKSSSDDLAETGSSSEVIAWAAAALVAVAAGFGVGARCMRRED